MRYPICRFLIPLFAGATLLSCGNGGKDNSEKSDNPEQIQEDTTKTVSNGVLNIGGELFSIPSPMQTAMLIQGTGAQFDKSILNTKDNMNQYGTDFSKALNLGIFGADLGYVSMYNKSQEALSYLAAVKKLSDDLGLAGAFDNQTMERFKGNLANKDSLMVLVGVAYRAGDAFLKKYDKLDISGLILTGGWIESLNFSLSVYKTKPNEDIKKRVADQKQALSSVVKLLSQFEAKIGFGDLVNDLRDLNKIYESVKFNYVYEKPETDVAAKSTSLNCHSDVTISDATLKQISEKIEQIRKKIVNPVKA